MQSNVVHNIMPVFFTVADEMELLVQAIRNSVHKKVTWGLETSYCVYSNWKNKFLFDNKI